MSIQDDEKMNLLTAQKESMAFEQEYLQHIRQVYIVAYGILKNREDAEDVVHDVFLSYFEKKGTVQIRDTKAYLLKMARNKALNYLRKKKREEPVEDVSLLNNAGMKTNEDNLLIGLIEKEIYKLSPEERQVFTMHVNAGLGFRQISAVMEMSVPAVYRKYRKAVKNLQKALKGGGLNE